MLDIGLNAMPGESVSVARRRVHPVRHLHTHVEHRAFARVRRYLEVAEVVSGVLHHGTAAREAVIIERRLSDPERAQFQ